MAARKRPRKLSDGEWSNRSAKRKDGTYVHLIRCCDCSLSHIIQYQVTNEKLRFRAWRLKKRSRKKNELVS